MNFIHCVVGTCQCETCGHALHMSMCYVCMLHLHMYVYYIYTYVCVAFSYVIAFDLCTSVLHAHIIVLHIPMFYTCQCITFIHVRVIHTLTFIHTSVYHT